MRIVQQKNQNTQFTLQKEQAYMKQEPELSKNSFETSSPK